MLKILTTAVVGLVLSLPAGASEKPTGSVSASAIIDQTVFNAQGQQLGELEDLVLKRNGSVKKVLVSVGGFFEVGDKLIAARYKSLEFAGGKMVLDTTKKQLEDQPEFDYRRNGLFTNYHYRLYHYNMMPGPYGPYDQGLPPGYRQRWADEGVRMPPDGPQGDGEDGEAGSPYERRPRRHRPESMQGMRNWYAAWNAAYFPARMLASVILGQAVVNKQGEEVATVEDLLISPAGKVDQLILSYGGFLDIGDNLAAVSYRAIGFTSRGITYDITRRELESLPKYRAK
jgi:sporulation protein YlmC with PRC-barrel domain